MAVVFPLEGRARCLYLTTAAQSFVLALFVNDLIPDESTEFGDIEEPSEWGYTRKSITWGLINFDGEDHAYTQTSPVLWTHDGSEDDQDVYGWLLLDPDFGNEKIILIERFAAPKPMSDASHWVGVVPTFSLGECI